MAVAPDLFTPARTNQPIRFVIFVSYGNDSVALLQWAHEQALHGVAAYLAATIPADVAALTVLNCAIAKRSRRMAKTSLCWCAKDRNDVWCANASGAEPDEDASSVETLCGEFIILPHGKARRAPTCHRCMDIIRGGSNG